MDKLVNESIGSSYIVPIYATKNYILSPDSLTLVETKINEAIPPGHDVIVRPLDWMKSSNLIIGERLYTKSYVALVNLAHGNYLDEFWVEFDGCVYDLDSCKMPKGFFRDDELYAIDYVISKGDIVAFGEVTSRQ